MKSFLSMITITSVSFLFSYFSLGSCNLERTCFSEIDSWRSGQCPESDYTKNCFWCYDQCKSDSQCGSSQKCCPQRGCGNECMEVYSSSRLSRQSKPKWTKKISHWWNSKKQNFWSSPKSKPTTIRPKQHSKSKNNGIIELTVRFKSVSAAESPDGVAKEIITINDMFPGPTIRAKLGDTLTIRVHNRLRDRNGTNHETSVHYHGIEMKLEPWMDGPELVTQCPIPYGQHMDYSFTLHQSGSYWYHSHHQWQYIDGFWGWLIVDNKPDNMTMYSHTSGSVLKDVHPYDDELIISLMDWYWKPGGQLTRDHEMSMAQGSPRPDGILINGKGNAPCSHTRTHQCDERRSQRVTIFNVIPHRTYRVRLLNPSAKASFNFSIDGHKMRVIEVDGVDTTLGRPVDVITLWPAQRYSVLVNMHSSVRRPGNNFWIRADMLDGGTRVDQASVFAFLHYFTLRSPPPTCGRMSVADVRKLHNKIERGRKRSKGGGQQGRPCYNSVPWEDQMVMSTMPNPGTQYRGKLVDNSDKGETYVQATCLAEELQRDAARPNNPNLVHLDQEWCDPIIVNSDGSHRVEEAPMIVHHTVVLNATIPDRDWLINGRAYSTHGQRLPAIFRVMSGQPVPQEFRPHHTQLGQTVQIVINNLNPVLHPYHLHGHTFYVMGTGREDDGPFNPNNPEHQRIIRGQAMRRDTTHTLRNSWSVVRIVTNNPGVWILHCHIHWHLDKGLAAVFVEGERAQRERYTIPEEARRVCRLSGINLP